MSVKPYNSYKFNKPLFKSEYSNITKSIFLDEPEEPLRCNEEIVIPICEPTDIQGVRKFKNATIQLFSAFTSLDENGQTFPANFPIPYFLIATEYHRFINGQSEYQKIILNSDENSYFIPVDYSNINYTPTEILNKGTLLFQGQLLSDLPLIQSTRLSKNLDSSECIYLILKIPKDPSLPFIHLFGIFGTINYSVKYS